MEMKDISFANVGNCGRPITLKRRRPNPLFHEWLEELLEEAKKKKCKLELQLTEALTSISKYPLPLNSGSECKILKGFDTRLCNFIDQRLKNYDNKVGYHQHIDNRKHIPISKSVLNTNKEKKHLAQILCYSSILIALNRPRLKYKENISTQMILDNALKEMKSIAKKLITNKLTLADCPQYFEMKDIIKIDCTTNNCILTETGLTEAYYLQKILGNNQTNVASRSSQTEAMNAVEITDLTSEHRTIQMNPGDYDVILLIDKNETSGLSNKNDPTVAQFKKYSDLKHEYRSLKVGDFAWIARHKVDNQEIVLPFIVERKRLDDLSASIKDGRFHEQKFRLRRCGLDNVIYMVESYSSKKYMGLPVQTLLQALANTRVQDGFKVHMTDSLSDSVRFLAMMTKRLTIGYRDKTLIGRSAESENNMLMTFEYFNKMSMKSKPLTVTETFIKLLLQLKGLSVEKALAITNIYKTPKSLIQAYDSLDREQGELLLANMKNGELSRNVGPVVSKTVYQLFSSFDIH